MATGAMGMAPTVSMSRDHCTNLSVGFRAGNHYGTPKPPAEPTAGRQPVISDVILPGRHPNSEGKRRRNRSNVEAMAAKSAEPEPRPPDGQPPPQQGERRWGGDTGGGGGVSACVGT